MKHPGKDLGSWIKARRKKLGTVARVFAGQIELPAAEYAEVELGVARWIGKKQETLIPQVLGLTGDERAHFASLLTKARNAEPLEFSDVVTREQLEPVRLRHAKRTQLTKQAKEEILDAVFSPLK